MLRQLLRSLQWRGWDGRKLCHGRGRATLMPQVSASTGGDSPSVLEREGKVVLQCHLPICLPMLSCGARPHRVRDVALLSPYSPPFPREWGMAGRSLS